MDLQHTWSTLPHTRFLSTYYVAGALLSDRSHEHNFFTELPSTWRDRQETGPVSKISRSSSDDKKQGRGLECSTRQPGEAVAVGCIGPLKTHMVES